MKACETAPHASTRRVGRWAACFLVVSLATACSFTRNLDEISSEYGMDAGSSGAGGTQFDGGSGGTSGGPDAGEAGTGAVGGAAGSAMVYGVNDQSCEAMSNSCLDNGVPVTCCSEKLVTGGTFPMGRGTDGVDAVTCVNCEDEQPEHTVTVADFFLDTFEVTVGRFRAFVEQYDGTPPPQGAGAHPLIPGSGWQSEWDGNLPSKRSGLINNLECDATYQTWTASPGANEHFPIGCMSWYEAFSFCVWDAGRLPTEAEWEYAAAGGDFNRLYPWGQELLDETRANVGASDHTPFVDVGSHPAGAGRWGQHDLIGNSWEWILDWHDAGWYSGAGSTCVNCANVLGGVNRVKRGGSWGNYTDGMRAADRDSDHASVHFSQIGIRCARTP